MFDDRWPGSSYPGPPVKLRDGGSVGLVCGRSTAQELQQLPMLWSHIPKMAYVRCL